MIDKANFLNNISTFLFKKRGLEFHIIRFDTHKKIYINIELIRLAFGHEFKGVFFIEILVFQECFIIWE